LNLFILKKGLYKNDNRFGPGQLKYPDNSVDVGYWYGDKLVRLLASSNINFSFTQIEPIDKKIHLNSWYDRENLLFDTLNPQNIFLNRLTSSKANKFIKSDPYMEKILEQKVVFYDQFLKAFEKFMEVNGGGGGGGGGSKYYDEYRSSEMIEVENITPSLLEIFKHFSRFKMFNKNLKSILNFDVRGFEKCTQFFFSSVSFFFT
jgi:hypothetical protein